MERAVIDDKTTAAYETTLDEIRAAGLFKAERSLESAQGPRVTSRAASS